MKNLTALCLTVVFITFSYMMLSFSVKSDYQTFINVDNIEFPEEVQTILDNKCMTCHNTEAKNFKSQSKMNFDKFSNGDYSQGKAGKKLGKITKKLDENKMPPEKYLEKHPEKKLTKEESDLLKSWANNQKKILSGK